MIVPNDEPSVTPRWRDPADYGYSDLPVSGGVRVIPNAGPESTTCRSCGSLAIDHTPGEFSIFGMCPGAGLLMPLTWDGDGA